MEIKINNTYANLETLTFAQLKAMVPTTEGKLPSYKKLMEMNPEVLLSVLHSDIEITVYRNGYFTGISGGYVTVYTVDRCNKITYRFDDGSSMDVPESEYADGFWLMPLELIADHRLEDCAEHRENYVHGFSIDGTDTNLWTRELSVPDFATELEERELEELLERLHQERLGLLEMALADLTEKQLTVVKMYFLENQTQEFIADSLGVNRKAVSQMLQRATARMKKYIVKNMV